MRNPAIRWHGDTARLPRISIVTPCLNHGATLEATLLSVLEQGYPQLEYVVMDGGSTDRCAEIIAGYADYLAHWQSRPDAGQYHAIERGFVRTTGEIMAWLNADDMLHRNALWTVAGIFQQLPQVEWIIGLPTHYDAIGRPYAPTPIRRWSRYAFLHGDHRWIQQESVFWRRSLWDKAGARLSTEYRLAADLELWMRFFRHARLHPTTAILAGFRHIDGQRSRAQFSEYVREAEQIIAREPRTEADRRTLARLARFDRWWFRIPIVRGSWRVRHAWERLFQYPPIIAFGDPPDRFEFREG